jgi:23S rRNA (cytidine2498-2'-O)-methyltransferase
MIDLLLLCKPGFERDAAVEWQTAMQQREQQPQRVDAQAGLHGASSSAALPVYAERSGHLRVQISESLWDAVQEAIRQGFVFISDAYPVVWLRIPKTSTDRTAPIAAAVQALAVAAALDQPSCVGLRVVCPESSAVPGLERFCSSFAHPLRASFERQGLLERKALRDGIEAIVTFVDYEQIAVTLRSIKDGERAGRRGRVARGPLAPSRSGSKLAEAARYFDLGITARQGGVQGAAAMRGLAVDLGAAPGGWTSWLAAQGYSVIAVDNGSLDAKILDRWGDRIEHRRADAFHMPIDRRAVLVVCDVVDRPEKVTDLMIRWAVQGGAETLVFNLKLPMKRHYEEVARCLQRLHDGLTEALGNFQCQAHQLYHDRQEITVVVHGIVR